MLKSCSICGKIHDSRKKCYRSYKRKPKKRTDANRLRSSSKWTNKSIQIRRKAFNLCEVCKAQGFYNYKNLEVHHIEPIEQDKSQAFDDDNLICLCVTHHKQAERGYISKEYLKSLVEQRETSPL